MISSQTDVAKETPVDPGTELDDVVDILQLSQWRLEMMAYQVVSGALGVRKLGRTKNPCQSQ